MRIFSIQRAKINKQAKVKEVSITKACASPSYFFQLSSCYSAFSLTLFQAKILDSSRLKESADNKFKFDENGRKFSK